MPPEPTGLSISAVAARTGIPVSTLRFYERELPGLFHIRKTAGGHRRYGDGGRRALRHGPPPDRVRGPRASRRSAAS